MVSPRIAVFAYSDTGHACLEALFDAGRNVVFVGTHADRPEEAKWFPSVGDLSRAHGIEPMILEEADGSRPKLAESLRRAAPDLVLSFYFRGLLSEEILRMPALGAFNIHGSLLPRFRGRAPVNWAVLKGETTTGATLHVMTARADAGDVVDRQPVPIGPNDTAIEVQRRVTEAAVRVLVRRLPELEAGTAPRTPQDDSAATKFGRRTPADGRIDWTKSVQEVHNLVRAVTHPFPGAFTDIFGGKTFIWKTLVPNLGAHDNFPGQIRSEAGRLYVSCGDDRYIEIAALQREGEPEMEPSRFVVETPGS